MTPNRVQRLPPAKRPGYYYTRLKQPQPPAVGPEACRPGSLGPDPTKIQIRTRKENLRRACFSLPVWLRSTAAILACVQAGGHGIGPRLPSMTAPTFFLRNLAPQYGINVVWVTDNSPTGWKEAFDAHPDTKTGLPRKRRSIPTLRLTDIRTVSETGPCPWGKGCRG